MGVEQTLICSESFVKRQIAMDENIDSKYIQASIREVQETQLLDILGQRLLDKLKTLIYNNTIGSYSYYKTLADKCCYFIGYAAMSRVCIKTAYKIANAGVVTTINDKSQSVSLANNEIVRKDFEAFASSYCDKIQRYLLDNHSEFPELDQNQGNEQGPNLHTMSNCSIWLGGARGKNL